MTLAPTTCSYEPCGTPFRPKRRTQKFCSGRCRQAHHRAHPLGDGPGGKVAGVRRLARGRVSVVVHFEADDAERALKLALGELVRIVKGPE